MTNKRDNWLKHPDFLIGDVFCLFIAYLVSQLIIEGNFDFFRDIHYWQMNVIAIIASLITSIFFESYRNILSRGYYKEFRAVIKHIVIIEVMILMYMLLSGNLHFYQRSIYIVSFIIAGILMYLVRIGWKKVIRKRAAKNPYRVAILIITKKKFAESLIKQLTSEAYVSYQIKACIICDQGAKEDKIKEIHNVPIVGTLAEATEYAQKNIVDEVLIQLDEPEENIGEVIKGFMDMGIAVHIGLAKILGEVPGVWVGQLGGNKVLTISIHKAKVRQLFAKRIMDIFGGVIGLLSIGIVFVILAPIIKSQSPGPIFFSQDRVGKNGRKFKIYKFRSMYVDAEERKQELMKSNKMQGFMFKIDDDPRITPIGSFIRKHSIDELPQFWNVLKGDMSLVGTRPPTVDEFEKYNKHHRIRLSIKPGITGMWQVSGRSDIINFEDVVKLDEKYIREWNLGLDIKILGKTILAVFTKKGAA